MNIKDKVLFVTGAGSGIGKASALVCAGYGAKIIAVDLVKENVEKTVEEIKAAGGDAIAAVGNVTDRASVKAAIDAGLEKFGRIDVAFNAAGVAGHGLITEITDKEFDLTMNVNIKGTFVVNSEIAKVMIKQNGGRIINTSSIAGTRPEASGAPYGATKAAVKMFTQCIALELGEHNISAVTISPGIVETPLMRGAQGEKAATMGITEEELVNQTASQIPLGKITQPEEIGELVAFLCDDRSFQFDGSDILFDGGRLNN